MTTQKTLKLKLKIRDTKEVFEINNLSNSATIYDLKKEAEFVAGLPFELQRVHYLDEGDLKDEATIRSCDIVSGATIDMEIWNTWAKIAVAATLAEDDMLFALGVTPESTFNNPNSLRLNRRHRKGWLRHRGLIALFVASHRGHASIVQRLIESGIDVNGVTATGRTPLHFAAASDKGSVIDLLLRNGADVNIADEDDETALQAAARYGRKSCERYLFLFRWQDRARQLNVKDHPLLPLKSFQKYDSSLTTWIPGAAGQLYVQKLSPIDEFMGTTLSAPARPSDMNPHATLLSLKKRIPFAQWLLSKRGTVELPQQIEIARARAELSKDEERRYLAEVAYEKWLIGKRVQNQNVAKTTEPVELRSRQPTKSQWSMGAKDAKRNVATVGGESDGERPPDIPESLRNVRNAAKHEHDGTYNFAMHHLPTNQNMLFAKLK